MSFVNNQRLKRLPPYLFGQLNEMKLRLRQDGADVIDLGMANPDQPTPAHIVDKLIDTVKDPKAHRYSASKGIPGLLRAICRFYKKRFQIDLDWRTEAVATIGTKEGLAHLALALLDPGDFALVPNPSYPIHTYSVAMAGANVVSVPLGGGQEEFIQNLEATTAEIWPKPKLLTINYPHNPTALTISLDIFEAIVRFAKNNNIIVVHDLAYGDITFDDYRAPSFLQVPGAKEVGVEFYTASKSYNMAGWRVGFCLGNRDVIEALSKIKSYYDYGIFTPIQVAASAALDGPQDCVTDQVKMYEQRRNVLHNGLTRIGWSVDLPTASMFTWAPIPEIYQEMGSMEFSKMLMEQAHVSVAPGIGFGTLGEGWVRLAMVENEHRLRQAIRNIRRCLTKLQPDTTTP